MRYHSDHRGGRGGRGRGRGGRGGRGGPHRPQFTVDESTLGPVLHEMPDLEQERTVQEEDVGITAFASPSTPGFSGIIKHRFSDFNVCEIDLSGTAVHLRSLAVPDLDAAKEQEVDPDSFPKYGELSESERGAVTALSWARLLQLAKKFCGSGEQPSETEVVSVDVTERDKEQRTRLHDLVKARFPHLTTSTEAEGERKVVRVFYKSNRERNKRFINDWPADRPKFLHFTLFKEDVDSAMILRQLTTKLQKGHKTFETAGTKDKRARTTQRVSVSWTTPKEVRSALDRSRFRHNQRVAVGDFAFRAAPLRLGDLKGNKFVLVLRDVQEEAAGSVDVAMTALRERGFVNFYGLQRFGTTSIKTSDVGLAMLKEDWQTAVELIMRPRPNEHEVMAKPRAIWWKFRRADLALKMLGPGNSSLEATLLKGLVRAHDNDLVGALQGVHRYQRLLYIHAYQSIVWNRVVASRVQKHGLSVLVGDLYTKADDVEMDQNQEVDARDGGDSAGTAKVNETKRRKEVEVHVVTEENLSEVSVYDVVMPLPGHNIRYPENELKALYEEELARDGMNFESFKTTIKSYSLSGDYRKMVSRPMSLEWRTIRYSEANKDLVLSDLERAEGRAEIADEADGDYLGLVVQLSLGSSNYATVAMREALKINTGKTAMSILTKEYEKRHQEKESKKRKLDEEQEEEKEDGEGGEKKKKIEEKEGEGEEAEEKEKEGEEEAEEKEGEGEEAEENDENGAEEQA